jgi:hypothetical protein
MVTSRRRGLIRARRRRRPSGSHETPANTFRVGPAVTTRVLARPWISWGHLDSETASRAMDLILWLSHNQETAREVSMTLVYGLIWGTTALFGVSAVWGLVWAVQGGQLRELRRAGRSIFDEDEPVGLVTDAFPTDPAGPRRQMSPGESAAVRV